MSIPSPLRPRLTKTLRGWARGWNRLGEQTGFYVLGVRHIGQAIVVYKEETLRVIAQLALGVGALALIGGAVVIVAFIVGNVGILAAIVGHTNLDRIGVVALAGFFAAYVIPRVAVPLLTSLGLAATVGSGTTAQLGAMRINEEIDALEVMGIRTIAYLVSTRVLGGVIVAIPLAWLAELSAFVTTRYMFTVSFSQASGGYEHYFHTFLNPTDTVFALIQVGCQALVIMLIHTYYGFTASGGPAGVGEATGRAVRASMVMSITVTALVGLILYGRSGNFHLSG
jgi:phospholipid/cholesterol/gamma-HCH transport system permease protein